MTDDLVDRLLGLGLREKTLAPDTIAEFSRALRERAQLILDERVAVLEKRNRESEAEAAALRQERAALQDGWKRTSDAHDAVKNEWKAAAAAHDRLLAHHHETLRRITTVLEEIQAAPAWGFRKRAQKRLAALLDELRRERP